MPTDNKLEDVKTDELDKLFSGNALDNEIRAFEGIHFNEQPKAVKQSENKEISDNQQKASDKDNKVGEGKQKEISINEEEVKDEKKTVTEVVKPDLKTFDKIVGSNLAKDKIKVTDDKKEIEDNKDAIKVDEKGKPIRNLEGFGEQEKLWLQRMPYESYEYFSKILKERKEVDVKYKEEKENLVKRITALESGKQILPESYYDNPNAFILSPEFGSLQSKVQLSRQVEDHWTEQLRKIERGENWIPLTNDPKTGEIVFDDEREYSADDKVYVLKQLTGASQQAAKFNGELEHFVGGFNEIHKTYVSKIKETEKTMLPVFENKESVEYKTYEAIKPKVEQWGIRRENPAFDFLTKAVALNIVFRDALLGILSEQQKTKSLREEQIKAGPTASSFSGGGGNNNVDVKKPTFKDFNKVINPGSLY